MEPFKRAGLPGRWYRLVMAHAPRSSQLALVSVVAYPHAWWRRVTGKPH